MREINWTTLISGIVAAGKLVSSSFGITIPDELINDLVNGVAAIIAVAAIFMSHKKIVTPQTGGQTNADTQYTGSSDSAV
jgi:uncharacterized membrane protein